MPIGLIVTYTLMFNGGKEIADATVTHHGLVDKGLYTHTISPGKSVKGFVYFKLPDSKVNLKDLSLIVQASSLAQRPFITLNLLYRRMGDKICLY